VNRLFLVEASVFIAWVTRCHNQLNQRFTVNAKTVKTDTSALYSPEIGLQYGEQSARLRQCSFVQCFHIYHNKATLLQLIRNTAARTVILCSDSTTVLWTLQWLLVSQRFAYKTALLTYKVKRISLQAYLNYRIPYTFVLLHCTALLLILILINTNTRYKSIKISQTEHTAKTHPTEIMFAFWTLHMIASPILFNTYLALRTLKHENHINNSYASSDLSKWVNENNSVQLTDDAKSTLN